MPCRYSIRVGRSVNTKGPFVDMDGHRLTNGGGTTVYGSNHGVVYAPGGLGVLAGNSSRRDILYFHYCMSLRVALVDADESVNTTIGWADKVSTARIMGMGIEFLSDILGCAVGLDLP